MNQHLHAGPRVNLFKQEAEQEELGDFSLFKNDTLLRPVLGEPSDSSFALTHKLLCWVAW